MKNILKGKALEDFEKWYIKFIGLKYLSYREYYINRFLDKHPSEQYGVLEDWFDSVGLHFEINRNLNSKLFGISYTNENTGFKFICSGIKNKFFERNEARIEAIKKGVEIYNSMTNG